MKRPKEDEPADPLGSWFGSIQVGLPGEEWPEYEGVPMLPLCQFRCEEISALPTTLKPLALICVFTAFVGEEALSPEGERWVVRTYESLEGLVPIMYPGDATRIRAYPIRWLQRVDSPPDQYCLPESLWIDFEVYRDGSRNIFTESKVGGYRSDIRNKRPSSSQLQADFVFQTRIDGDFPWLRGPNGTFFFSYSYEYSGNTWSLAWEPLPSEEGRRWRDIRLGFEVEGMLLFLERPSFDLFPLRYLGMCYRGHFGRVQYLSDLRGAVHITTSEMALLFVRLQNYHLVIDPEGDEYEVLTEAENRSQPDWLQEKDWRQLWGGALYRVAWDEVSRNVLDAETFRKMGFESARVEPLDGAFRVVRWTYKHPHALTKEGDKVQNPHGTYRKLAERVATDGAYTRTVLEQFPAPDWELLRPATSSEETDAEELLRPAKRAGETDPDELLRPPP